MAKNISDQKSVSGVAVQVPEASPLTDAGEAQAGDDISALEPEALVAALDDPARAKQAAAGVTKRLESTPKANRFAYRFLRGWSQEEAGLLTAADSDDLNDAFDGLRRVCFKAIGSHYAPDDQPPVIYVPEIERWVTTDRENTAIFIEERILELLNPYRSLSERDLLIRALKSEFKNLPRAIGFDLIDLIRKQYTKKAKVLNFLSFDATPALLNPAAPASSRNGEQVVELLVLRQGELVEAIGQDNYETLLVAADFGLDQRCPDSKQSRKSGLSAAIARVRGVGMRQARNFKRKLHEAMNRALGDKYGIVPELFASLDPAKETVPSRRTYSAERGDEDSAYFLFEGTEPLETSESVAEDNEPAAVLAEIPE